MMRRKLIGLVVGLFFLAAAGCGSDGSGSSSPAQPSDTSDSAGEKGEMYIVDGDGQTGLVGEMLAEPLTVIVYDETGVPAQGLEVQFSVPPGSGILSSGAKLTAPDGLASVNFTLGGNVEPVPVTATVTDVGSVTFSATPMLPVLGDVIDASINGEPVADFPSMLGVLGNGQEVLVLMWGVEPGADMAGLPTAADLLGGEIQGYAIEDYPVTFVSGEALMDSEVTVVNPTCGLVASRFMVSSPGDDLPVVTDLMVNGDAAVVGILGDPSGINGTGRLGDLIDSGVTVDVDGNPVPVSDLPVFLVEAADYPLDPAADDYSYTAPGGPAMPLFSGLEPLGGSAAAVVIPTIGSPLPTSSSSLVELTGGGASHGALLAQTPPAVDVAVPITSLNALPLEWVQAFNVIEDKLVPLMDSTQPIQDRIDADIQDIGQAIQDNWDTIQELMNGGGVSNPFDLLPLASDLLPAIDDLIGDFQAMIPFIEQQLAIVETDLLPAILEALPEDGIPFGGYTDGVPSTVADDVIPYMQAQIDVLQSALPAVNQLLEDIDALIPDYGGMLTLLINIMGGGLDDILADVEALVPYIADGLVVLDDQGIPILYDVLEEVEQMFPPGESPLSGTDFFLDAVGNLEAAMPPDTTLGDMPGFSYIEPILGDILPPEWGDPSGVSLFDTVIPEIGDVDIGADVLPGIRDGLDSFDASLPGIIDDLYNFGGFDLGGFDFSF